MNNKKNFYRIDNQTHKPAEYYWSLVTGSHADFELLGERFVIPKGCLYGCDELGLWAFTRPKSMTSDAYSIFTCALWRFDFLLSEWSCKYPNKYSTALGYIYDYMSAHGYNLANIKRYSTKANENKPEKIDYQLKGTFQSKAPCGKPEKAVGMKTANKIYSKRFDNISKMNFGEHVISHTRA